MTDPTPAVVATPPVSSPWSALGIRAFRALWLASLISNVGTWMQSAGAAWMMTSLTMSPVLVALMQTAGSLPFFLLALPGGALADIVDRRRVLIVTQAWMAARRRRPRRCWRRAIWSTPRPCSA